MKIKKIIARQILDSRGNPTVEVDLHTGQSWARAAVPSGASTGIHEAHELRDGDKSRFGGKGVLKSVLNITQLGDELEGQSFSDIYDFDKWLLKKDGTDNKSNLGANSLLGLSLAFVKAQAQESQKDLFEFLLPDQKSYRLPVPLMNIINGGAHANNGVDVQEFMIAPVCGGSFSEALRAGVEVFHSLKKVLNEDGHSIAVGDEGGFAPKLESNKQALEYIMKAIENSGYKAGEDIFIALDVAATELFDGQNYRWEGQKISPEQLIEIYKSWTEQFPVVSIEDGASEDDWDTWIKLNQLIGSKVQLIGDDLFVTNQKRLKMGIEKKAANALLVKINQIGTISETIKTVSMCHEVNYSTIMSHRSGETEDNSISDLAVGLLCSQIKTGSPCRGERTAKYNQLLRIEQSLGPKAKFWGVNAFKDL